MKSLIDAAAALARVASQTLPEAEFRACSLSELEPVRQVLPLSDEILEWYTSLAPYKLSIPLIGNPLGLYSPLELIEFQDGYRWLAGDTQRQLFDYWEPAWVVIGDTGADPVIAHTNFPETPISGAWHGTGSWDLRPLAPGLASFIESLTALIQTLHLFGEEYQPLEDALKHLREKLLPIIGPENTENFCWLFFG